MCFQSCLLRIITCFLWMLSFICLCSIWPFDNSYYMLGNLDLIMSLKTIIPALLRALSDPSGRGTYIRRTICYAREVMIGYTSLAVTKNGIITKGSLITDLQKWHDRIWFLWGSDFGPNFNASSSIHTPQTIANHFHTTYIISNHSPLPQPLSIFLSDQIIDQHTIFWNNFCLWMKLLTPHS